MQVIYKNEPNEPHVWVDIKQFKSAVLAQVCTDEELNMRLPDTGKYYWAVSLIGGDAHPLWEESTGTANTIREAKDAVTNFLKRI